jgi:excisionase family DNA binding protein
MEEPGYIRLERGGRRGAPQQTDKLLLTISEVCRLLSCSRATVYRMLQRGDLVSVGLGRSRRVRRSDLEAFVAALPTKPVGE